MLTLSRAPLETALDHPRLYALGVDAVRQLAGHVWSDHNDHDPGVTALEIASFVITDLSTRASFPIEDLLAVGTDNAAHMGRLFPSARTLLTNRPLTIRDYRKLLIDLPGVRNAWLMPAPLRYFAATDDGKRVLFAHDPALPDTVPIDVRGLYRVLVDFTDSTDTINKRATVLAAVRSTLHKNRNLCEDFVDPVAVERQRFQICGEIELEPGRDVDVSQVQAEIFFAVQDLLAPPVPNYSLAEMQRARKPDGSSYQVDEIFDGPPLTTGFIKDDELDRAELPAFIRLSDVINVVMDVKGVRAVRDLLISPEGVTTLPDKWVVPVEAGKQPTLVHDRSRLVYYKSDVPVSPVTTRVEQAYADLSDRATRKVETIRPDDRPIPVGRVRNPGRYYSFQNHFPQTYGIGEVGLEPTATPRREILARQLKGYLLFFDQVMADCCALLQNFGELFSINPAVERTYFHQAVDSLRGFETIYNVTVDASLDRPSAIAKAAEDAAGLVTEKAGEAFDVHEDRRHRFLDHLIARYAERFHEYASAVQAALDSSSRLLRRHKCRFLRDYPSMSGHRGGAYDITTPVASLWDSKAVSGLEWRLSLLLDTAEAMRRNLSAVPEDANAQVIDLGAGDRRFQVINSAGTILLKAPFAFATATAAKEGMTRALEAAQLRSAYIRHIDPDGSGTFSVEDRGVVVAQSGARSADAAALDLAIDNCLEFVRLHYSRERMFVIENLLLRSSTDGHLLTICGNPDCGGCADDDPYSYRIHVILPADAGRFANQDFRAFVEGVIRAETPAHILPKVCWISLEDQRRLDKAYHEWIDAGRNADANGALERLRDVLESVKNVYPQAKLADCESPEGMTKFQLGRNALGDHPDHE